MGDQPEMDAAADKAHQELEEHWQDWSAKAVGAWWARWFDPAGHRRLGRVLMDVTKTHPGDLRSIQRPPARR